MSDPRFNDEVVTLPGGRRLPLPLFINSYVRLWPSSDASPLAPCHHGDVDHVNHADADLTVYASTSHGVRVVVRCCADCVLPALVDAAAECSTNVIVEYRP